MQTFKAVCAKNGQKVELIIKHENLADAREALHKQGYSIIEIRETQDHESEWNVFYFDIIIDGKKKNWQIQSTDLFKAYIKLVDDLHYQVTSIYESVDLSEEEKMLTTSKIKASYAVYKDKHHTKAIKQEKLKDTDNTTESKEKQAENITDTYIWKELQLYYGLLDKILYKIENIINSYGQIIGDVKKAKLWELHIVIKQLKNITNINKLRLVSEAALLKIGELELELMRENIDLRKQDFTNETNQLLRKFWSNQKIRNPEKDVYLKMKRIADGFFSSAVPHKDVSKTSSKIDTQSFVFYKNVRELNIYRGKLTEINKELLFALLSFNKEKQQRLALKKKLVLQNIQLVQKRIKNINFSYTKIVKWFEYYVDVIVLLMEFLGTGALYIVLIFSLFYAIFITTASNNAVINYAVVMQPVVLLSFFALLSKMIKGLSTLVISGIFYFIFLIFLRINF